MTIPDTDRSAQISAANCSLCSTAKHLHLATTTIQRYRNTQNTAIQLQA